MAQQRYEDRRQKSMSVSVAQKKTAAKRIILADNRESTKQLKKQFSNNAPSTKAHNITGLPDNLKTGMESLTGMSLDHVKVHYNSAKPATVQAHAYAQGSDIHLASGQEKHLPHELGHVVQQAQGRVKATSNINGMAVNENAALENEATAMGDKALRGS